MRCEPHAAITGFQDAIHRIVAQAILLGDVGQCGSIKGKGTSIGGKPHPSLAVLHDAMHDPGAGHASCRIRIGFGTTRRWLRRSSRPGRAQEKKVVFSSRMTPTELAGRMLSWGVCEKRAKRDGLNYGSIWKMANLSVQSWINLISICPAALCLQGGVYPLIVKYYRQCP